MIFFTACHRLFVIFIKGRNDRAATKGDDEDEEYALLFDMFALSFCELFVCSLFSPSLTKHEFPRPQINMCILSYTLLEVCCALHATAKFMFRYNYGEVEGERQDEVDLIEACRFQTLV
jgi:hypothetical protein